MVKTPAYHLIKSEPYKYSFAQLCSDGSTAWEGVRSFEARNNLRAMRVGDLLLFYHSNEGKEIVGVARVITAAYGDPTAVGEDWAAVDVAAVVALARPVTLAAIKAEPRLADCNLLRRSRLSVVPVTAAEFALLLRMGGTALPAAATEAAVGKSRPKTTAAAQSSPTKTAAAQSRLVKAAAAKSRPTKTAAAKPLPAKAAAAKSRATASTKPRAAAP